MSKEQMMHKLGNAVRALKGRKYKVNVKDHDGNNTTVIKTFIAPSKSAKENVDRWAFRLHKAGHINDADYAELKAL